MTKRVVAPRFPTPATPASGSGAARLPDDVVDEQVRRVWLFSGISAFMWSFGMLIGGGTANIQRNIIAERGLGLPR